MDSGKHEKFEGERTLMRIHIGESDQWHGQALYQAIVNMLRAEKFSGVTVLRGEVHDAIARANAAAMDPSESQAPEADAQTKNVDSAIAGS